MVNLPIPTADQFKALAEARDAFEKSFVEGARNELFRDFYERYHNDSEEISELDETSVNASALAKKYIALAISASGDGLNSQAVVAIDWLEAQPSFQLALRTLGYADYPDGWSPVLEKVISTYLAKGCYPDMLTRVVMRRYGAYLRYVSGIALASHRYITRQATNEAIDGIRVLAEIRDRLVEAGKLLSIPLYPKALDGCEMGISKGRLSG
jgi:hypothetical protein